MEEQAVKVLSLVVAGMVTASAVALSGCALVLPNEDRITDATGVKRESLVGTWRGSNHQKLVLDDDGAFAAKTLQAEYSALHADPTDTSTKPRSGSGKWYFSGTEGNPVVGIYFTDKYDTYFSVGKQHGVTVLWTAVGDMDDHDYRILKKS